VQQRELSIPRKNRTLIDYDSYDEYKMFNNRLNRFGRLIQKEKEDKIHGHRFTD